MQCLSSRWLRRPRTGSEPEILVQLKSPPLADGSTSAVAPAEGAASSTLQHPLQLFHPSHRWTAAALDGLM